MPKDHARKNALREIKQAYGVSHSEAIAILDDPEPEPLYWADFCDECGSADGYRCNCDQYCDECGATGGTYGCNCY